MLQGSTPQKKHWLNIFNRFSLIAPSDYEFPSWNGINLSMGAMNNQWEAVIMGAIDTTRFRPNRPAADMEGNGEFNFCLIYEDFWRIFYEFLEN